MRIENLRSYPLLEVQPERNQIIEHGPSQQRDTVMALNMEASWSSTLPSDRYCTDTNANDDGTVASRMACCYPSRFKVCWRSLRSAAKLPEQSSIVNSKSHE